MSGKRRSQGNFVERLGNRTGNDDAAFTREGGLVCGGRLAEKREQAPALPRGFRDAGSFAEALTTSRTRRRELRRMTCCRRLGPSSRCSSGLAPLSGARLLLRHAVDGAQAEDQVAAGDGNDFASREEFGECVEGEAVAGIVEDGEKDDFVGDVEVGVGGGKALAVEVDGSGHGQSFNAEGLAVLVPGGFEEREIFLERRV